MFLLVFLSAWSAKHRHATDWQQVASNGHVKYSALGLSRNLSGFVLRSADVQKRQSPLFEQDKSWEPRLDNGYPNVVYDPTNAAEPWRLWYGTCGEPNSCSRQYLLYANSTDGLEWHKPNLNRYDIGGDVGKNNNIIMYGGGLGIYHDVHDSDPKRRFKISGGSPAGCYDDTGSKDCIVGTAASPDGINMWNSVKALGFKKPWRPDCHTNLFYDNRLERYIMTTRDVTSSGRDISIAQSSDGPSHWTANWTLLFNNSYPETVAAGDEILVDASNAAAACGLKCRQTDNCAFFWVYTTGKEAGRCFPKSSVIPGPVRKPACVSCGGQFYQMDGDPSHPANASGGTWGSWDEPVIVEEGVPAHQLYSQITFPFYDVYFGIVMVFDAEDSNGHVHCVLSWSPDGKSWSWVDPGGITGKEFIPAGPEGSFDSHVCFAAHLPVRLEDGSARLYFMGGNGPHSGSRNSSFGLATVAPDRFAGLTPSVEGTAVAMTTRQITVSGATLTISMDILAPGGAVVVGLVGQGPAFEKANALTTNATDVALAFPKEPNGLVSLLGKPVQLSFTITDAIVYTVGFK